MRGWHDPLAGRLYAEIKALDLAIAKLTDAQEGDPVVLARAFHDAYERLAPSFGYVTREDTRVFDPASPNGRLMIAVATEVLAAAPQPPIK